MADLKIEVSRALRDGLVGAIKDALRSMDTAPALALVEYHIRSRTARGEFLPGSSPGASKYSAGHRRFRERGGSYKGRRFGGGAQTSRVDLQISGEMLDALRSQARFQGEQLTMEVGYLDGLSEEEASRIAAFHDREGAGRSKVVRHFVGLTEAEADKVVSVMEKALLKNL